MKSPNCTYFDNMIVLVDDVICDFTARLDNAEELLRLQPRELGIICPLLLELGSALC
jgi:hypothetical protein